MNQPQSARLKVWTLKKGMDRRFRSGHPWIYSNELQDSPKGVTPGEWIDLRGSDGSPLAIGYGNSASLIAFRKLAGATESLHKVALDLTTSLDLRMQSFLAHRLAEALRSRLSLYPSARSFRWVFGEADGLPGLVIDTYKLNNNLNPPELPTEKGAFSPVQASRVIVLQPHTAGAEKMCERMLAAFTQAFALAFTADHQDASSRQTASEFKNAWVILRRDAGSRRAEGLEILTPLQADLAKKIPEWGEPDLRLSDIQIELDYEREFAQPITLHVDLLRGQKTGFFLDQVDNVAALVRTLRGFFLSHDITEFEVLDLCPYVGQWSSALARLCAETGVSLKLTLLDVSQSALTFAEKNVRANFTQGLVRSNSTAQKRVAKLTFEARVQDVLEALKDSVLYPNQNYDLVVGDPPAFIKGKKDLGPGSHAYLQLNTHMIRVTRSQGFVVSSSCSGQLGEEGFSEILAKAQLRNGARMRWFYRGGQSKDHPTLAAFSEGIYLKTRMGMIDHDKN